MRACDTKFEAASQKWYIKVLKKAFLTPVINKGTKTGDKSPAKAPVPF